MVQQSRPRAPSRLWSSLSNLHRIGFKSLVVAAIQFIFSDTMGINCTSHYLPQSLQEPSPLSSNLYKPFPRTKRCIRSAVIMQLTGEGLASSNPPRYMNEMVTSVRYHYQYQCLFAAQDDSVLIYGEKWSFTIFKIYILNLTVKCCANEKVIVL